MIKRTLRLLTLFTVLGVAVANGFDFTKLESSVTEHRLKNGLTVLVLEQHDAPVASFVTVANVGSVDDPKGYTGLAHMFEHLAFKGTTTLGSKDFSKEKKAIEFEDTLFMQLRAERNRGRFADSAKIADLTKKYEAAREASYQLVEPNAFGQVIDREGGEDLNAFTANDITAYFYSLPSNKAELWMALESERFLNPVFREMYKERDVVAEERRMRVESNPFGKMFEEFDGVAFSAHPYGITGVGHMSDIQYYSRAEAKSFFDKYYGPSNLVVAVVGDVNTSEIIALAEKYFGRIPYRPAPERIATVEPPQSGERRSMLEDPSQPVYMVGWHTPEVTHPDRPALQALSDYLASGRTSLLYSTLVKEKKMAVQVGAFNGYPGDKYPAMTIVLAIPAAGKTNEECEKEIFAAVEQTQNELLPMEEVEKIRARAKASFIAQLRGNQGLALQLGIFQTYWGDWREMFNELNRINAVTPQDIQRVAKEYLTHKNRVVVMMNTAKS